MANKLEQGYLGNPNLKRAHTKISWTREQLLEFKRCKEDCLYFIENYVKINNLDDGIILFKLYPFQREMIKNLLEERFNIFKLPRQSGKTQLMASYFLWKALFHKSYKVAILANIAKTAWEITDRMKMSLELLPKFLQQGVVEYNKGNIKFENFSEIRAGATTKNACRGFAFNAIYLDEFAFVDPGLADEFYESVYPTISTSRKSQICITSTPKGINNLFYKLYTDATVKKNKYRSFCVHWNDIPGRDAIFKKETIANIGELRWRQEFEGEFIGASNTLIDASCLQRLVYMDPIETNNFFRKYKDPIENHIYVGCVDTGEGGGNDFSVTTLIDISVSPYEVVGVYAYNKISPTIYPATVFELATYYNDAYLIIENNSIGYTVAENLINDFEYENILYTYGTSSGEKISAGYAKNSSNCLKMTKKTKAQGCSAIKFIIENGMISINDFDLYAELTSFIRTAKSFAAEAGSTDDIVMTLVMFGWLTQQEFFKELQTEGLLKEAKEKNDELISEEIVPFGYINNGLNNEEDDKKNFFKLDW